MVIHGTNPGGLCRACSLIQLERVKHLLCVNIMSGPRGNRDYNSPYFHVSSWEDEHVQKLLSSVSLPEAAITNYHKPDVLKQQKCIRSLFWRLEFWNQGVSRVGSFPDSEEESVSCFSSCLWWMPAIFGTPWLVGASLHSLPPSSHGSLFLCLCVSLSRFPSSSKDTSHWIWPTLTWYDLIVTWLHPKRPYFQIQSHLWVLGLGLQRDILEDTIPALPQTLTKEGNTT